MSTSSARCIVVGEAALTLQCSHAIIEAGCEVVGVFTRDPALLAWAKGRSIHAQSPDLLAEFAEHHPFDYLFSIVNGRIIPEAVLAKARMAAINFHDGPLPRYAGFFSTTWALLNREREYGVSWHRMTGEIDAGEIVRQRLFPVSEAETAFTLNAKCYEAGLISFGEMIGEISHGSLSLVRQDLSQRTYFPRWDRPSAACLIPFEKSCSDVDAFCRALDFGPYANPMGLPKILLGDTYYGVSSHAVSPGDLSGKEPGTILRASPGELVVALQDGSVAFGGLVDLTGQPVDVPTLLTRHGLHAGDWLHTLPADVARRVSEFHSGVARHEGFWVKRLARMSPLRLGTAQSASLPARRGRFARPCPAQARPLLQSDAAFFEAACLAFLHRLTGEQQFTVGVRVPLPDTKRNLFASAVPLTVRIDPAQPGASLLHSVREELAALQKHRTFTSDLAARYPELRAKPACAQPPPIVLGRPDNEPSAESAADQSALTIQLGAGAAQIEWLYDESAINAAEVERWSRQFANILLALADNPDAPLSALSLMSAAEVRQATREWNQTETTLDAEQRIHCLVEAQALRTPDAIAVTFEGQDLTYRELNERANQLARYLQQHGAGQGTLVAISTGRSLSMVVGLLGILKSGAAYVPLDATYPAERLSLMMEDSRPCLVVTEEHLIRRLPAAGTAGVICLDADWPQIAALPSGPLDTSGGLSGADLAYVIYTSGSTGRPKGVMVSHANVANFFAGMDQALGQHGAQAPGVWLAVTSISFDISVLELFWTLARGFQVVIASEEQKRLATVRQPAAAAVAPSTALQRKETAFSLFYFAAYDSTGVDDPYRLLMEGARFADENGFEAVWTPERHFHAFGGLYPNPSVTSAALAAITRRVKIRAGSSVLPLHHPVRLAEEWAFVDRLSGGRTGISFASGWHQRDFILAPDNFAQAKEVMFREIETVRKLWRGESVTYSDGKGVPAEVRILPRPTQAELPVWVTAAGNVETFRMAGERGFNLLTHLLGQSIEQLAGKITAYREALAASGRDPASGKITLMLHTFVGRTIEEVRETVRVPFTNYLKSSVDLIKNSPWSFPAFAKPGTSGAAPECAARPVQLTDLAPEDLQALLDHSFDRYFESSGLFGTVDDCVRMVEKLQAIGVDEVGCLVDFGVDTDTVLQSLRLLKQVMDRAQRPASLADDSLAAQMERYQVTHLQCTPSLAGMLVADPETRQALARLRKLLVGGEALPSQLALRLLEATPAAIHNMYGPTETTVWSTTAPVSAAQPASVIGRPIANTQIYLLDENRKPVPVGVDGEIYIGGQGVARGYWNRPDLTAERFVEDPFGSEPGSRLYRTGDLARYLADGRIEYVGRIDHQVKIRGFRIELGEIEDALLRHPQIKEAVVVARESASGDKTLAAYYVSRTGEPERDLKAYLEKLLPSVMVPPSLVRLDAMPLTPNGKVDRKALPEPSRVAAAAAKTLAAPAASAPANQMEGEIAAVWREVLGLDTIGMSDNFFDLGAHSILMVQAHLQLKERLRLSFSMIDLFQFPTVRSLAAHLAARVQPGEAAPAKLPSTQSAGSDRALARKSALARRPPMGA